ncbi:hypothetical protein CFC21_103990 [Triticum aestivum]|uniref:RING-type E3 ubiquitin transferase n=3 Tax=Triticum TaxID=4564 RepID=A0A9R1A5S4_TRITD|nr:uncharacterized protein LOC119341782 [Triticum dicoccoides]XP_044436482.1 uncharacterized protein LOC123162783 [Triticum aestivum]KAF7102937.1 hypothetical protein CFC21_103990 [Triticum aestivum]VAI90231.1 unnamed protein product [Triticum turgidum subsp. durum]
MAPPPPKNPILSTYHLRFLLLASAATFSAAFSSHSYSSASPSLAPAVSSHSYSSACPSLPPAADRHTDADDALSLTRSFQIENGHFSAATDSLFSVDGHLHGSYRSFSLYPRHVLRTTDPTLVHLIAVIILIGPRSGDYAVVEAAESVSFDLDGYYSFASLQLCMAGAGAERAANGRPKYYEAVALSLRIPSPFSLTDPFVTGSLDGSSDFEPIQLLAYADGHGHDYKYRERSPCDPPVQLARGSLRALGGSYACAYLKERLVTSYRLLDHEGGSPAKLPWMHVSQMQCNEDGALRAYMVVSNDTGSVRREHRQFYHLLADEEALVADGHWDPAQDMFCLRACWVAPSTLAVRECGIGMSFWFPATWTVHERSVVAGVLWNSTQGRTSSLDAGAISGVMSAFSMDDHRRNISDVQYKYNDTMLEVAKKHYLKISKEEKIKGSFPVPGKHTTYHDLSLRFWMFGANINAVTVRGDAYPVTIGSVMTGEEMLMTTQVDTKHLHDPLNVSYDIHYYAPLGNSYSYSSQKEERRISAEGVYDPKKGVLCMVGCEQRDGSMDCQMLITVQFTSLEDRAGGLGGGGGAISSLRDRSDRLFFERKNITLYGMYAEQVPEAISRMDLESIMVVASVTLSCVFTALQILHVKKNPEAAAATSITMLTILTLGHLTPLVLNFEVIFPSRRSQYDLYSTDGSLELNQVMMKVPTLIAFVLQLRLLQLVVAGHLSSANQSEPATSVSEKTVLQICLPLYLLGGVLATVVHMINVRSEEKSLVVRIGGEAATLWDELLSYAGLVLDGFLLPQVILNASLSSSRVRAISPWFYMGGTMIRVVPHVYDVVRMQIYAPSMRPSDIYASPGGDLFGVAWDVLIFCGAALLASLLFLQQRLGSSTLSLPWQRRSGGCEMVSHI